MAKPKITIVGLGLIGASIGLGLSKDKRDFEIVGHDKENQASGQAKKLKAVDKTNWNLINACDGADLVILALPALAIRDTLAALAGELKPGCIVMDTASIKAPVLAWAEEHLPPEVHFIGSNPIVSSQGGGTAAASADLFTGAIWAITPSPASHEGAVKMAADMVERLGGKPLFLDPVEHDGMLAGAEHLPALVGAALLTSITDQPTWLEMRKLAGGQFERTTQLASDDRAVFLDMILSNKENLLRWLDAFVADLQQWRTMIEAGDSDTLAEAFDDAWEKRERWQANRVTGAWDERESNIPERQNMLTSMLGFGGSWAARREREKEKKRTLR